MIARAAGAITLALAAGPVPALEATCRFEVECYETEPCDAAAFTLSLRPGTAAGTALFSDIAGETEAALSVASNGATVALAITSASVQLLIVGTDGAARYTLHLTDGPAVITYHGQCTPTG